MKNRLVAVILAFVFGAFGVHKFYLRDAGAGVFYIILFFITSRFFPVTAILGVIDAIRMLMMTEESFDKRYNTRDGREKYYRSYRRRTRRSYDREETERQKTTPPQRPKISLRKRINPFKKSGIKKYREFDLEDAIEDFVKGLEIEPDDIALHFNIACAYSLTEQKEKAYYHLSKAVEKGFKDYEKILTHDDLAFVRIQPEFDGFKESGFKLKAEKNQNSKQEKNDEGEVMDDVLLSQLNKLAELRKKGLLSEEEFATERKKLLRGP